MPIHKKKPGRNKTNLGTQYIALLYKHGVDSQEGRIFKKAHVTDRAFRQRTKRIDHLFRQRDLLLKELEIVTVEFVYERALLIKSLRIIFLRAFS